MLGGAGTRGPGWREPGVVTANIQGVKPLTHGAGITGLWKIHQDTHLQTHTQAHTLSLSVSTCSPINIHVHVHSHIHTNAHTRTHTAFTPPFIFWLFYVETHITHNPSDILYCVGSLIISLI